MPPNVPVPGVHVGLSGIALSELRGGCCGIGDATNYISEARRDKGAGLKITCYMGSGYAAGHGGDGLRHEPRSASGPWLPKSRLIWPIDNVFTFARSFDRCQNGFSHSSRFFQKHITKCWLGGAQYGEPVGAAAHTLVPNIRCSRIEMEIVL
jgi:hypothetical protein